MTTRTAAPALEITGLRKQYGQQLAVDDLSLRVDGDGLSGERLKVNAMAVSRESQLNPVVNQALALQSLSDTGCRQQIHRVLFENSGANPFLHVLPAAAFENDGIDSL